MNISLNDSTKAVKKDTILFKEGDKPTHLIVIESGSVLCLKKSKERLIPVLWADAQKVLGEEAILTNEVHHYSAIVMEDAEIVQIEASMVQNVIATSPKWITELFETLGDRSQDTASAIAEHRLSHPDLSGGQDLSPQEETRIKKLLG
ncbi:MAG: cyclic nucleotide-binding domain-containing protein [Bacteriovoracaceae bacterium]|nr:cyclic nucleotide-binding domain-containing protein [Bacteriovoracaceae bacterium]